MPMYTAEYRRDGAAWVVSFCELVELSTWGRTLDEAKASAREALSVQLAFDSVAELEAAVTIVDSVV
jgi:predicted RNase H-like HicB family nuclease